MIIKSKTKEEREKNEEEISEKIIKFPSAQIIKFSSKNTSFKKNAK